MGQPRRIIFTTEKISIMSQEISRRSENASRRLSKAEANAESKINSAMSRRFSRLERAIRSNWNEYQNLDKLPRQKAIALSKVLDEYSNLVPDTSSKADGERLRRSDSEAGGTLQRPQTAEGKIFRELYERSAEEGRSLAKDLLQQIGIEPSAIRPLPSAFANDFIDFWTGDSAGRLSDWGTAFKRDATAIYELGMSQGWSERQVNDALMARYGKLQQQAERIVRTGSVSTLNSTTNAYYQANGITLVQWQISRTAADRTCNYCSPRNGNVYYINEITYPLHPRERCVLLPVKRRSLLYDGIDRNYWKQEKRDGLQQLRDAGGKPNYGAAPFEKRAGRDKAPKPVWQPDKGYSYGEKSKTRRLVDE